ncbi:MAG TPA: CBS domain-containing protein [Chitinophagaceae bacterium]|nr:CBS domain-containing protein [Chitinophagaceae bacterium]
MYAIELISPVIPVLHPLDTGAKALQLLNEYHISHLPIVVEGEYLGLIREEEILDWDNPDLLLETLSYHHFRPAVREHAHFYEALKLASDFKLSVVPVLTDENKFGGVIPQQHLLFAIASMNGVKETGVLILLEMEPKDYSLAEIGRIAESNEITILSVNTFNHPATGKLNVLIKTNRQDMRALTSTFERFSYTITCVFGEEQEETALKKNYDLLMNYISM